MNPENTPQTNPVPETVPEETTPVEAVDTNEQKLSDEEIHQQFLEKWAAGDRLGAASVVLERTIYADEVKANQDLATIVLQPDAEKAFGAALMVKTLEEMAKDLSADQ